MKQFLFITVLLFSLFYSCSEQQQISKEDQKKQEIDSLYNSAINKSTVLNYYELIDYINKDTILTDSLDILYTDSIIQDVHLKVTELFFKESLSKNTSESYQYFLDLCLSDSLVLDTTLYLEALDSLHKNSFQCFNPHDKIEKLNVGSYSKLSPNEVKNILNEMLESRQKRKCNYLTLSDYLIYSANRTFEIEKKAMYYAFSGASYYMFAPSNSRSKSDLQKSAYLHYISSLLLTDLYYREMGKNLMESKPNEKNSNAEAFNNFLSFKGKAKEKNNTLELRDAFYNSACFLYQKADMNKHAAEMKDNVNDDLYSYRINEIEKELNIIY